MSPLIALAACILLVLGYVLFGIHYLQEAKRDPHQHINTHPADAGAAEHMPEVSLGELAQAMEAARNLAHDAGVKVPPQLAKDGLSTIQQAIRRVKTDKRKRCSGTLP